MISHSGAAKFGDLLKAANKHNYSTVHVELPQGIRGRPVWKETQGEYAPGDDAEEKWSAEQHSGPFGGRWDDAPEGASDAYTELVALHTAKDNDTPDGIPGKLQEWLEMEKLVRWHYHPPEFRLLRDPVLKDISGEKYPGAPKAVEYPGNGKQLRKHGQDAIVQVLAQHADYRMTNRTLCILVNMQRERLGIPADKMYMSLETAKKTSQRLATEARIEIYPDGALYRNRGAWRVIPAHRYTKEVHPHPDGCPCSLSPLME